MKFINPLPFVRDIERSKTFYKTVLGLSVRQDHGNFVMFDNGFAIHEGASLFKTVFGEKDQNEAPYGRDNLVLYFEVEAIEDVFDRLSPHISLIHDVRQEPWGQKVFRFHDPDRHIIEIGELQTQA